ncbi:MAG: TetR/AcrR family transcriptional regulator [Pseudomonadota bacterium]
MPSTAKNTRQYHHGDLHNALIVAAAELIEERGSDDFAMIDAARKAGVSSAAPYRHFKDKEDLLAGVSDLAFWAFSSEIQEILDHQAMGSRECIIALGLRYVDFVSRHGAFFDLMWGGDRHLHAKDGLSGIMKQSGFSLFYSAVEAWVIAVGGAVEDAMDLAMKLWCMAHGTSALHMNGQLDYFSPGINTDETLRSATESFLDGVEMQLKA